MVGSVSLKMANKNKINQKNSALCTLDKNDRVQTYDFISSFMSCNIWLAEIGFFWYIIFTVTILSEFIYVLAKFIKKVRI